MRTEYITTKVRPIRKLFIIEQNDFDAFGQVLRGMSHDIEMIFNIFLENNDSLFSNINKEFVKRQNIDIIFNLSNQDNKSIENHFAIECITPNTDMSKIGRYITDLRFISNRPALVQKYSETLKDKNIFFSDTFIEGDVQSIQKCINFGYFAKDEDGNDLLSNSAFRDMSFVPISDMLNYKEAIFDKEKHYCRLYDQINPFISGYGGSVYEIDYAHNTYFKKGKHSFVSSAKDLSGVIYFWNMRAAYPSGDFFWFPEENFQEYISLFDTETIFIASNEIVKKTIRNLGLQNEIFIPTRLYFHGMADGWELYKHSQVINIANQERVFFTHPIEKTFSEFGMGGACIFEIAGLKEFFYPNNSKIGKLFYEHEMFPEQFTHLQNRKLTKYYLHISPFEMRGLDIEIHLPDFQEVVSFMFKSNSYILKQTDKASILNQIINTIGGLKEIILFCNEAIFDLLIKMKPQQRTEKLNTLIQEIDNGNIELTPVIRTLKDMNSIVKKGGDKDGTRVIFQKLSDKKLLLRGKQFKCEHCSSMIWIPLDSFSRINYCHACNNEINLPIDEEDKFRLNQLLIRAIDQGQLSTLLLLNFFVQNSGRNLEFLANQEVFRDGEKQAFTDIDLIIKIGDKIGFAECKSDSGFDNKQIDDLIDTSISMNCQFVAISSLQSHDALQETINYIDSKNLEIPLFIFTREILFEPQSVNFYSYFETTGNAFPRGAITLRLKTKN